MHQRSSPASRAGDGIRVEGKLDGLQQQLGKQKVEFILTECIAETR
ncbi:MAG: hypothetical protein IPL61_19675 [Myxococcales bacterium]|nr:hypothetical protein [Myxococcales bacterium]